MQLESYQQLAEIIRTDPESVILEEYTQSFLVASIAPAAVATAISNIDASAYFVWCKTTYFAANANASQTENTRLIPLVTVQLTDSGSQRQLFDIPQPISNIAGHEGIPQILEQPYLYRPNSNISGRFVNFDAAVTYVNLYLTLIGYRVKMLGGRSIAGA